jgi:hypothetical protein
MSAVEVVAFATLWIGFIGLAALVLVLYRQVEKAYAGAEAAGDTGLVPGSEIPEIEVLADVGEALLPLPDGDDPWLIAFVTTSCSACSTLLEELPRAEVAGPKIALVSGEDTPHFGTVPGIRYEWLAHPPDVVQSFGVVNVPMVYVVRGTTVLASGVASTTAAVDELLRQGLVNEESLGRAHADDEAVGV